MYNTIISSQGFGITPSPEVARDWIHREPVIELRSFYEIEVAYRFGCTAFMRRRQELGKVATVPLPRLDAFLVGGGEFFPYSDMAYPAGWEAVESVGFQRHFAYFSQFSIAILSSSEAVASLLKQYQVPALVMEMRSIAAAQNFLLARCYQVLGAISPYALTDLRLPDGYMLQLDAVYPLPEVKLHPDGQRIWGDMMIQGVPGIDHTPLEVLTLLPPKK